jgi:hypothetical protein
MTPMLRQIMAFLRRDVLAAISIVGMAIHLIGSVAPLLVLAHFIRYAVTHWLYFASIVWIRLFALIHVAIPPLLGFSLTLFFFHLGLTWSALRIDLLGRGARTDVASANPQRDRLFAILLYIPILLSTLYSAFSATTRHMSPVASGPDDPVLIDVAFAIVLLSPVMMFLLSNPRLLIRRLLSVYVVAGSILLINLAARALEDSGLARRLSALTDLPHPRAWL